jgi:dienelactone hydrolase
MLQVGSTLPLVAHAWMGEARAVRPAASARTGRSGVVDLYYEPTMYGIEDVTVGQGDGAFAARIYYPSNDGTVFDVPIRPGTYRLIAFAHGQRAGGGTDSPGGLSGPEPGCPEDSALDHQRWSAVLHLLARCGFVVLAPALQDVVGSSEAAAARLETAIGWIRGHWEHREVLWGPNVFVDPDSVRREAAAGSSGPRSLARLGLTHLGQGVGVSVGATGMSTDLGVVGHSWGARACARVAVRGNVRVRALAAIAGSWDEDAAIEALIDAKDPTLLIAGTGDVVNLSYLRSLWPALVLPKHQAVLQGIGHWDWFGGQGGIHHCDPATEPPPCPVGWMTASELLVGFMSKYLRNRWYLVPPSLIGYRGPSGSPNRRPNVMRWYEPPTACGLKIRWDDPMADPDRGQVKVGEITAGAWSEGDPW